MTTEPTRRPVLQRFLDSFFQEQNIRWMLALGLVTVFGSSLMLVRSGWEQYQPAWRQVVVLLYGATIYFAGAICRRRLSLPKTAAFLRGLSLLLIPVAFLALNLLRASESVVASGQTVPLLLTSWPWLLGLTGLLSGAGAWRIFTDVFRGPQRVFTGAFLILAAAGAVVPVLPHSLLPLVAAGLWCVLTVGSIAITREVFHLTERHRAPMWAGYLPLCLLGVEFIGVFSLGIAGHLSLPLTGLGLVLTAIPVLHAAETLLKVFRQRTGGLVQRLPVAVAAPGLVGLLLCAGGLVLAAGGFPPSGMVVPAALITAAVLLRAAKLTEREALVWIGLVCLSAAYQFSPVLFRETAREALAASAEMVRETRMPLAFYGLTWLPLLAALAGVVPFLRRRGHEVFVRPIELFSLVLTGSLFLVAFGHVKALFPVSLALGGLSIMQTVVFRRPGWLRFSLAAGAVSCAALPLFLRTVCGWELPVALPVLLVALYSAGLTGLASLTGRTLKYSQLRERLINGSRVVGLITALAWSACLTLNLLPAGTTAALLSPADWELVTITTALLAVLLWHAVRWPVAGLSEIALAFACGGPALAAAAAGVPGSLALAGATVCTALCWIAGRMSPAGRPQSIPRTLSEAALRTAGAMFCGLTALWVLPAMFCLAVGLNAMLHLPEMNSWPLWLAAGLCLVWSFDVARLQALPGFTCLGLLLAGMLTAAGTVCLLGMEQGWHWMPLVLACLPAVALWPVIRLHHSLSDLEEAAQLDVVDHSLLLPLDRLKAVLLPLQGTMMLLAVALAAGSLAVWTLPLKLTGVTVLLTAVAGRMLFRDRGRAWLLEAWLAVQASGLVLSLLLSWLLPEAGSVLVLAIPEMWYTGLPLAAASAGLMLPVFWLLCQREQEETDTAEATVALLQSLLGALWLVCLGGLFGGIIARFGAGTLTDLIYAAITFGILCGRELLAAHRSQQEQRVASAGILAGVGSIALWLLNGTAVPLWIPALALVLVSLLLDTISRRLQRNETVSVLARPFARTALALPVASLLLVLWWPLMLVGYSLTGAAGGLAEVGGPFVNPASVTALLTGCLFLLYGLRDRRTWCVAAALLALNGVFAESCLRLGWRDPQVFCMPLGASVLLLVELLRNELPANWRTPLRMVGGLIILLSPLPGVFDGSWLPLFTLMAASIVVTLLAIGLRVRSMTYLGTAFLLADLVGMVLRGSVDHPGLLWVAGLVTGGCVMALAAFCENHRELLASRLRQLAAELETWQ